MRRQQACPSMPQTTSRILTMSRPICRSSLQESAEDPSASPTFWACVSKCTPSPDPLRHRCRRSRAPAASEGAGRCGDFGRLRSPGGAICPKSRGHGPAVPTGVEADRPPADPLLMGRWGCRWPPADQRYEGDPFPGRCYPAISHICDVDAVPVVAAAVLDRMASADVPGDTGRECTMVQDATDTDSSFSVNHASARLVLVGDVGHEVADNPKEQASCRCRPRWMSLSST